MPTATPDVPIALGALAPEERVRMGQAGLRTFFRIADRWGLGHEAQTKLLGDLGRTQGYEWRREAPSAASVYSTDLLTRLSAIIAIYGALQRLYGQAPAFADAWITAPSTAAPYGGQPPVQRMLDHGLPALLLVRRLLEAQSAGGLVPAAPDTVPWERLTPTAVADAVAAAAQLAPASAR